MDVHSRVQKYVSTHDTADCAGRADHRHGRCGVRGETAYQSADPETTRQVVEFGETG